MYHSITARVGRDPKTVSRISNRCVEEGHMERRAISQRSTVTNKQKDRHLTRMILDRAARLRVLNKEMG